MQKVLCEDEALQLLEPHAELSGCYREDIQAVINVPDNDQELIKRYCQGNLEAFEALYQKHRKGVYLRALGIIKDKEEANHIIQECFIQVWKSVPKLRERKKFKPWLYQIVTNLCLDYLRRRPPVELVSLSDPVGNPDEELVRQIGDKSPHPEELLENSESNEKLQEALSFLSLKQGEVFTLRCIEGLSCKDTAKAVNCSERTVKRRLAQAKSIVRKRMMSYLKADTKNDSEG